MNICKLFKKSKENLMDKNAKKEKPVRKFKICMMGPSYVGKT